MMIEKAMYMALGAVLCAVVLFSYSRLSDEAAPGSAQRAQAVDGDDQQDAKLLFTNIYRGNGQYNQLLEDADESKVIVVDSKAMLDEVWFKLFQGTLALSKPNIDFENQYLLIGMTEQKEAGEYLLTIRNISVEDGAITVEAEDRGPGEGCTKPPRVSRPVHVVAVSKTEYTDADIAVTSSSAAPCSVKLLDL